MSQNVEKYALEIGAAFVLGAWLVTPSLNTLTLMSDTEVDVNDNERADNEVRKVTPKVMALCEFLVRFHGQVKSQQEIAQAVWPERVISDSSIYQAIAQLRKALQHDSDETHYVERVSGKGYRIHAPISAINTSAVVTNKQQKTAQPVTKLPAPNKNGRMLTVAVIALLILLLFMLFWNKVYRQTDLSSASIKTVAVLPTENLSIPHNEVFNNFSQLILSELVTDSSHKFIYLRAGSYDESESTQAQTQLVSSVQRNKDKLIASVQLLESSTGKVLWAENFTTNQTDYLQLKNYVVAGLRRHLRPHQALAKTENNDRTLQDPHFEEYALAHYFWDKREPNALQQAKTAYQKILQQSPQHLGALVGLCHTYLYLSVYSDLPQALAHQYCKPYITKAIALAPNKGEVIATQALLQLYIDERDNEQLDKLFRRAIKAAPNYAMAHHWYGNYLRKMGQFQRGLEQHRLAYSLDPLSPIIIRGLAYGYLNLRQLDHARRYYQRALTIEPHYAHRAVEELDFLLLNSQRASAFIDWLDKPSNIANKPAYRLTQALVWLGLGDIKTAQQLIEKTQIESVNKAFLLYCQGALASAQGDFQVAQEKMTERLNLTPDAILYVMPYITALFYNDKPAKALSALQYYFPEINNEGIITNENSGLYVLRSRLVQRLKDVSSQQKINTKLRQFINTQDGELSPINQIYWAFINEQSQQTQQLIHQLFNAGWLPDYNDNIFALTELKHIYVNSGGNDEKWQQMLTLNRSI